MSENEKPLRRRKPPDHPEDETAALLYATYQVECRRHEGRRFGRSFAARPGGEGTTVHAAERPLRPFVPAVLADGRARFDKQDKQAKAVDGWRRLACVVIAAGYDPETFVRRQFVSLGGGDPPPPPAHLSGPVAEKRYHAAAAESEAAVRAAFKTQASAFEVNVAAAVASVTAPAGLQAAQARTLADQGLPLSPLFRYCVALSLAAPLAAPPAAPFRAVADAYRVAAAVQYVFEADAYDRVWGPCLPAGWRRAATGLYDAHYQIPTEARP